MSEALLSPYEQGPPIPRGTDEAHNPMLQMVLARIRQLAAHETGHTLGLDHNFAANAHAPYASVMDFHIH
jgi:predicted Zn-dependent protease